MTTAAVSKAEHSAGTLTADEVTRICMLARQSKAQHYSWKNRGIMPPGYCKGMAVAWACAVRKFHAHHPAFRDMARANTGKDATDALSWYNSNFRAAGMHNDHAGIDTLRHLYVMLMGLGMRESSGRHCEGIDVSAGKKSQTSITCEAGLYQTSWNIRAFAPTLMQKLFDEYAGGAEGYMDIFKEGVYCTPAKWKNYGTGPGAKFQEMSKRKPLFAAEVCALGLRHGRRHWGPVNRKEVEIRKEADDLFLQVQDLLTVVA